MWIVVVISLSLQKALVPSHSRVMWLLPVLPGSLWISVKIARIVLILCCCFGEKLNLFLSGGWLMWSWEREKAEGLFAVLQWEYVKTNYASYFQQLDREGWTRRLYEMWIYNRRLRTHLKLLNKIPGYQPGKSQSSWCRRAIPHLSSQHCLAIRFSPLTYLQLLYNIFKLWFNFQKFGGWRVGRIESVLCLCCCFKSSWGQ